MSEPLACVECGTVASGAGVGWKADIGDDPRDDEPAEVVFLCPDCWEREFGKS